MYSTNKWDHIENFENVELMTFEPGKKYTMPSGLVIVANPRVTHFGPAKGVVEPCGVMRSRLWNSGIPTAEEIFGKNELVIGDFNDVSLLFPKGAKNFFYNYYQIENYTEADSKEDNKTRDQISKQDQGFQCSVIGLPAARQQITNMVVETAYDGIRWGIFEEHPFIQLIFAPPKFGSLHIDSIKWDNL